MANEEIIESLTSTISQLESYKDDLENRPGVVISAKVKQLNDLLKTNLSQEMSDNINTRKEFFQNQGLPVFIDLEIERVTEKLNKMTEMLSNLQSL